MGEILSVNVGRPRPLGTTRRGRLVLSAIVKSPVPGRVALQGVNLAGDEQADRSVHGGTDKAVPLTHLLGHSPLRVPKEMR